jgi:hypothetical protein
MQGYLFSKPVVPEQMAELLRPSIEIAPPLAPEANPEHAVTRIKKLAV